MCYYYLVVMLLFSFVASDLQNMGVLFTVSAEMFCCWLDFQVLTNEIKVCISRFLNKKC